MANFNEILDQDFRRRQDDTPDELPLAQLASTRLFVQIAAGATALMCLPLSLGLFSNLRYTFTAESFYRDMIIILFNSIINLSMMIYLTIAMFRYAESLRVVTTSNSASPLEDLFTGKKKVWTALAIVVIVDAIVSTGQLMMNYVR